MEFVDVIEKAKKICDAAYQCDDCVLSEGQHCICKIDNLFDCNVREVEKIISEWKPVVDWSKVKVDTPIIAWDDSNKKYRRYFAKYEDGIIYAWASGCNSWSANGAVVDWENAELAEVEND